MKAYLIILLLLLVPIASQADTFEAMAGASYEKFDDYSDYDSVSFSTRVRYTRYRSGASLKHGLFFDAELPGLSILVGNFAAGYGIRSEGRFFWELGAGLSYGLIWGPSPAGIAAVGMRLGNRWGISATVKVTTYFADVLPLIVYHF